MPDVAQPVSDGILDHGPATATLNIDAQGNIVFPDATKADTTDTQGEPIEDVKTTSSSSDEVKPVEDEVEKEGDSPEVAALKKELTRVRAQARQDRGEEIKRLRDEVADLRQTKTEKKEDIPLIKQWSEDKLTEQDVAWTSELSAAHAAYREATLHGDGGKQADAQQRIATATQELKVIRSESTRRIREGTKSDIAAQQAEEKVQEKIVKSYADLLRDFPDAGKKGTALYAACETTYAENRELMERLGPMADLVAAQMAITQNPQLIAGKGGQPNAAAKARKDLLNEIEKNAAVALTKATSATPSKKTVDYSAMPVKQFETLLDDVISGKSVF